MRLFSCIAFALFLAAPLALPAFAAEPESPDALIGQTDAVRAAIQEQLSAKFTNASEARKSEQGALVEYYSIAENRLLWVDDHGLNDRAKSVMEEIGKADEYGLRPADYPLPKAGEENPDVKWLADAEIKISFAVLGYARDARGGRIDPQRISPNLDPDLMLPDPLEVIESIAFRSDPASYLRSFQPDQPQFEALRQALIVARGGNPDKDIVRIPDGPTLELGVDHEQVALLRKRLNIPVEDGGKETVFDASVHAAVQRFQEERGVLPDGAVGAGTRRLLNQPHHQAASPGQVRLILLNMERWRWLPHDLGSFYVNVNIPEFVVRVMGDGKPVHTARVVVGKPDKQTPILSKEMQEIVFNPYWNVPNSIKTEEIRPFLREEGGWFGGGGWNTAVLERHNLRVNIGGREVDPAEDRLEQCRYPQPQHLSAAGARQRARQRQIRVSQQARRVHARHDAEDPVRQDGARREPWLHAGAEPGSACADLAEGRPRLDRPDASPRQFKAARTSILHCKEKIPVYITYFTLRVNDDGSISTFGDIYGHDSRMAAALRL